MAMILLLASSAVSLFGQSAKFTHTSTGSCAGGLTSAAPVDVQKEFNPSGWMGDGEKGKQYVQIVPVAGEKARVGNENGQVTKIHYQPGPVGWAGVYWLSPANNWGDKPPKQIQGASKVVFWAAGQKGGEIVEFKAGGVTGKACQDSFEQSTGQIALTKEWKRYEIPLRKSPGALPVVGAFAWIASSDGNPAGLFFYVDGVRYE